MGNEFVLAALGNSIWLFANRCSEKTTKLTPRKTLAFRGYKPSHQVFKHMSLTHLWVTWLIQTRMIHCGLNLELYNQILIRFFFTKALSKNCYAICAFRHSLIKSSASKLIEQTEFSRPTKASGAQFNWLVLPLQVTSKEPSYIHFQSIYFWHHVQISCKKCIDAAKNFWCSFL